MTPYSAEEVQQWFEKMENMVEGRLTKTRVCELLGVSRPRFDKMLDEGAHLTETLAMQALMGLEEVTKKSKEAVPISQAIKEAFELIEQAHEGGEPLFALQTGFKSLTERGIFLPSEGLTLIAGPPTSGKSSLAYNLLCQLATGEKRKRCAFFSLERDNPSLSIRLLSLAGRVSERQLRTGRMQEQDWARLIKGADYLNEAPITLVDAVYDMDALAKELRSLKTHDEVDVAFIDNLHLITCTEESSTHHAAEEVMKRLGNLSRELDISIVATSSMNNRYQERPDRRPLLSDLKDAGQVEQHARTIFALYRKDLCNPETEDKGRAELHILKRDMGGQDMVKLRFFAQWGLFEDIPLTQESHS